MKYKKSFFLFLVSALVLVSIGCKQKPDDNMQKIIASDSLAEVQAYFNNKDINKLISSDGFTPLVLAIQEGDSAIIDYFIRQGSQIKNCPTNSIPLNYAILYRNSDLVDRLLNLDINPNEADMDGNTSIHMAAMRGSTELMEQLLSIGGKINQKNKRNWTALDFATIRGKLSMIEFITENGGVKYKKLIPTTYDGPYFSYQNDSLQGMYLFYDSLKNESGISSKMFALTETCIKGWYDNSEESFNVHLPNNDQCEFTEVSRVFAVSDIHGQYERFIENLKSNKVVDEKLDWSWDDGHLVIVGDIFDRGDKVTEIIWLVRKLERQAEKDNGKVHYLLGNHDIMMLKNDLRYIAEKYYVLSDNNDLNFSELFLPNTVIGKYLRSRNTIIKINDILYVHAGISEEFADKNYSIDEINRKMKALWDDNSTPEEEKYKDLYLRSEGPIWYRRYFYDYRGKERIAQENIDKILDQYKANRIVVGHTETDTLRTMLNGKVVAVNIPLWNDEVPNQALIVKDNKFLRSVNGEITEEL